MTPILAIDFDKWACKTYQANFPNVEVRCAKVEDEIDRLPAADVIISGPPCQSFSMAGKGLGEADPRNGWPANIAAVRKVRPRMFLAENVAGMLTVKHIKYLAKVYKALEDCGYLVQHRRLDSVNFGVPQFRDRIWVWGIRKDLDCVHSWPSQTHCWPPVPDGMFGAGLLPGVTVGEALGIGKDIRRIRGSGVVRRDHPPSEPSPSVMAPTGGKSGLTWVDHLEISKALGTKIVGTTDGEPIPQFVLDAQNEKEHSLDEPCGTIQGEAQSKGGRAGHHLVHEYRWSKEMLAKHPPASPASPASAIQAKFYKGGAEGLVMVDNPKHQPHQPHQPANSLNSGGNGHGMSAANMCLEIDTKQPRTRQPITSPSGTIINDDRRHLKQNGLMVRRLTPAECSRLMSMPDDFKWPDQISKTAKYKIIGNGQASLMAHHMAQALKKTDPNSETIISLFCGGGVGDVGFHGKYWEFIR